MKQLYMIIALFIVMVINTMQGCTLATIKDKFNKEALKNGAFKSFIILISFVGLYITVYFLPSFSLFGFEGIDIIDIITTTAIVKYTVDIANKLLDLLSISVDDIEDNKTN